MNHGRAFFWPEDTSLRRRRLLLCAVLLLASIAWFVLGALLAAQPTSLLPLGWLWIDGGIIALAFGLLHKTKQSPRAEGGAHRC